ncbi:hypothetical protein U9M48_028719 [Paspalum notatum var. saurae]|uniref:Uncharacterized protein n=1 Tax=Paspalum notatum var. saurae TaxID=547442 RepID=A0AAQ3TW26_PASNO
MRSGVATPAQWLNAGGKPGPGEVVSPNKGHQRDHQLLLRLILFVMIAWHLKTTVKAVPSAWTSADVRALRVRQQGRVWG